MPWSDHPSWDPTIIGAWGGYARDAFDGDGEVQARSKKVVKMPLVLETDGKGHPLLPELEGKPSLDDLKDRIR